MSDNSATQKPDSAIEPLPLELVATITVQLIAAKLVPVEEPLKTIDAAELAIGILHGCKKAIMFDHAKRIAARKELEAMREAPVGLSFKQAMLRITGRKREEEAQPLFKAWVRHELLNSSGIIFDEYYAVPQVSKDQFVELMLSGKPDELDQILTAKTEELFGTIKKVGFGRSQLVHFTPRFEQFYQTIHLPAARQHAGRKGARIRKSKK